MESNEREKIKQRKIALMNAKQQMAKFSSIKLNNFEDENSEWVDKFGTLLKEFSKITSTPTFIKQIGDMPDSYIKWVNECLGFLKERNDWLIIVPNCNISVWANVKINCFEEAIKELWNFSDGNEFVIADKNTSTVSALYAEEYQYEIHIKSVI